MKITIDDDFDLDKIIDSGQCFRPRKISEDTYRFVTGQSSVEITDLSKSFLGRKNDTQTELNVSCTKKEWDNVWHRYFDLARELGGFLHARIELRHAKYPDGSYAVF